MIVDIRSDWHDAVRIDRFVRVVVVAHDVGHVHRLGDARPLIERAGIGPKVGVVDDPGAIAFEVTVINRIKVVNRRQSASVRVDPIR